MERDPLAAQTPENVWFITELPSQTLKGEVRATYSLKVEEDSQGDEQRHQGQSVTRHDQVEVSERCLEDKPGLVRRLGTVGDDQ